MKLYTCCPNSDCGSFQNTLNFLKSNGIEPSILTDEEGHFFKFPLPRGKKKEEFCFSLSGMANGPRCKCGKFFNNKPGYVTVIEDELSGDTIEICSECLEKGKITTEDLLIILDEQDGIDDTQSTENF